MKTINDQLVSAIRVRQQKQTEWGYGILTADRYVKTLGETVGTDCCYRYMSKGNMGFDDLLRKASKTLVYSNPDMELTGDLVMKFDSGDGSIPGLELPKKTLMAFQHVLTTSRKDRDGDVLHSDGATIDPNMLLLWQHIHTLPIGKAVKVVSQDEDKLVMVSAIVDINQLCHDAAVMIDNKMGRFSHGFRATEFREIKPKDTDTKESVGNGAGFEVKRFEIMEESLVSVPANPDAECQEVIMSLVDSGKLKSTLMKEVGRGLMEKRQLVLPGFSIKYREHDGKRTRQLVCSSFDQLKEAAAAGLIGNNGGNENENRPGNGSKTAGGRGEEGESTSASEETHEVHGEVSDVSSEKASTYTEMSCPECGYKGKPNADGTCPECGAKMEATKEETKSVGGSKAEVVASLPSIYSGDLVGSWESTTRYIASAVNQFAKASDILRVKEGWAWVVGTFEKYVVIGVDSRSDDGVKYYKVFWELRDGAPVLFGDPKEVKVSMSSSVSEKSFDPGSGKPYPGEHAARMNNPDKYEKIRRENDKLGPGIDVIWGVDKDGKTEIQAIRFDSGKFTAEQAKKWLEEHDMKPVGFEEAKKEEEKDTEFIMEKAGRVLSKTNEDKIRRAKGHVDDVAGWDGLGRPHGAQLREASGHLGDVLSSLGNGNTGPSNGPQAYTLQSAMGTVLTQANSTQRKYMIDCLTALEEADKQMDRVKQYEEFFERTVQ